MADTKITAATSGAPPQLGDFLPLGRAGNPVPLNTTVGSLLGRNMLINGNFVFNSPGYTTGAVLASASFGHDRWKGGASGGDYSFTQANNSTTITIAAGKSLIQVVENVMVEGGTYVLSWAGTAQGRVGVNTTTPAGAYAASPVTLIGQAAGTTMSVEFNAGTLGEVMLAPGTVAAPFERRPYPIESLLCQRYHPVYTSNGTTSFLPVNGLAGDTINVYGILALPVTPRVPLTGSVVSAASHFSVTDQLSIIACTAVALQNTQGSKNTVWMKFTVAAGLTQFRPYQVFFNNASGKLLLTGAE